MLIPRWIKRGGVIAVLGVFFISVAPRSGALVYCQEPKPATDGSTGAEKGSRQLDEMKREAAEYRMTLDGNPPRPLALKPEPVLHWTNPLRKTNDGAVFLWVADGRPEVVASFYQYRREGVLAEDHEFQSVAFSPLRATREGQEVWFPRTPGITLTPFPDAPAPAASASARLRQMRLLAAQLRAFIDFKKDPTELRLLTKELYRYETQRSDLIDGALFAFVQTTDPEVLLLFEAKPADGKVTWHYGIARMSMVNLRVDHKGQTVWQVPWNSEASMPDKPSLTIPAPRPPIEKDSSQEDGTR